MITSRSFAQYVWIQTRSGHFDFQDIGVNAISIEEIAHSLSHLCRFTGHTKRFYSVAEHCVHVSRYVEAQNAEWGLLHDASEAYIGDTSKPLKQMLGDRIDVIEGAVHQLVADHFDLEMPMPDDVKLVDSKILANERDQCMGHTTRDWGLNVEPLPDLTIEFWPPSQAKDSFLNRYSEILTQE